LVGLDAGFSDKVGEDVILGHVGEGSVAAVVADTRHDVQTNRAWCRCSFNKYMICVKYILSEDQLWADSD